MEPNGVPPGRENVDRQDENAPLLVLALNIADWISVHGIDSLSKQPAACNGSDSTKPQGVR